MECVEESITVLARQEGFDFEFVPPLEHKYECAICLLGLRAPIQTTCGHRFCKDCIYNCLSESSARCPVDNTPLAEADLFPDSCVEREILQLTVRCPNHSLGCPRTTDLMYIEHHTQACPFQPVMCSNGCSATVLRGEMDQHLEADCVLRVKKCALCDHPFTFNQEQLHLLSCPNVTVPCEMCGAMMGRGEVAQHRVEVCPRVVVACTFVEHGCKHNMTRADLQQHMVQATQLHLQLLSSAYKKINTFVSDLSRTVGLIQSPFGNFSRQPSLRSQISATSPIPEAQTSPSLHDRGIEKSFSDAMCGEKLGMFASPQPPEKSGSDSGVEVNKLQLQFNQMSVEGAGKEAGAKPPSTLTQQEVMLKDVCEKSVDLTQRLLEETIRISNLSKRIEEVDAVVEAQLADAGGRYCHGDFVWRIKKVSQLVAELQNKPGRVCHSPPFYTHPFGYKFCLRINVTWKCDQYFLAMFIHGMQSENDDFLEWPFKGCITLSLLDCDVTMPKHHVSETMVTKPGLQAFKRPDAARNLKGFGFTEFVPLSKLLNPSVGCYIKDDTLAIRAAVVPEKTPQIVTNTESNGKKI